MTILQVEVPTPVSVPDDATSVVQFAVISVSILNIVAMWLKFKLEEARHARERREAKEDALEIKKAADELHRKVEETKEVATETKEEIRRNTQITVQVAKTTKDAAQQMLSASERRDRLFNQEREEILRRERENT